MTIDRTDDVGQTIEDVSDEQYKRDRTSEDLLELILIQLRLQTEIMRDAFDKDFKQEDLEGEI